MIVYDIETAVNRTILGFRKDDGSELIIDTTTKLDEGDKARIENFVGDQTLVGFNNSGFDTYILDTMMRGDADPAEVFKLAQAIITSKDKIWNVLREFNASKSQFKELDLRNFAGKGSLKVYEARMGMDRVITMPFVVGEPIEDDKVEEAVAYLRHDLEATALLLGKMMPEIEVRQHLGQMFELDLMGTGAAGAAERVVISEYLQALGGELEIDDIRTKARRAKNSSFKMRFAPWVHDVCAGTRAADMVKIVEASTFTIEDGHRTGPDLTWPSTIDFNGFECAFGLGGIHSTDGPGFSEGRMIDVDVASYYPHLLLAEGGAPCHLDAGLFRKIYRGLLERRLEAKLAGRKLEANALKLVLNSTFGKCNEKWSNLYSPQSFLHITLAGQLAMLALISNLTDAGVTMLSANTDGILFTCPPELDDAVAEVLGRWESMTGFPLERKDMAAYRRQNVNSYIAIYADGEVKGKGHLNPVASLASDPSDTIIPMAVTKFTQDGTPVADTIRAVAKKCDLSLFASVHTTKGSGFSQGDAVFGKTVRSYRCAGCPPIVAAAHGKVGDRNAVTGRKVFADLSQWPDDIDIEAYIGEAEEIIAETSVLIDNKRNLAARELERAGFATRGTGLGDNIRTGGNFSGSKGIAIDVAKRHGLAAFPAGLDAPGETLMRVMRDGEPVWNIRSIAGLDRKQMKTAAAVEGAVFNGAIEVVGDGLSYELVTPVAAPVTAVAPVATAGVTPVTKIAPRAETLPVDAGEIDNDAFLKAVFGTEAGEAYTVSFTTPANIEKNWSGGPARLARGDYHNDQANNYFSLSLFGKDDAGACRRRVELFRSLHCVLVDDIGTKVADPRSNGWGEPTLMTETSPGNHQMIYRLAEPMTDGARADALIQMIMSADVSDKGVGSVTRVARLPVGSNNKTTLAEPFRQVVKVWAPERSYTVADILGWMGKTVADLDGAARETRSPSRPAKMELAKTHPVVLTFKDLGMLRKAKRNGWFDVTCPWGDEHSGGRRNDGAAITIHDDGTWAFRCHHSCSQIKTVLANGREVAARGSHGAYQWLLGQGQLVSRPSEPIWGHTFNGAELPDDHETLAATNTDNVVNMKMFVGNQNEGTQGATGFMRDQEWLPLDHILNPWREKTIPKFPLDTLPIGIRSYVENKHLETGADPAAIAMGFLTVASGALSHENTIALKPQNQFRVRPNLWMLLVANPSNRKTAAIHDPIHVLQQLEHREYQETIRKWESQSTETRSEEPPPAPRFYLSDVTAEKLCSILENQDRGIFIHREEVGGMLISFARSVSGGSDGGRSIFVQSFDGGYYVLERIGRRTKPVKNLCTSFLGGIQPERIGEIRGLASDGLLARFIPVRMVPPVNEERPFDASTYHHMVSALTTLVDGVVGEHHLSDEAMEIRKALSTDIDLITNAPAEALNFRSFVGKTVRMFGSIALVLHRLEGLGPKVAVSGATAEKAAKIIRNFVIPHARLFYESFGTSEVGSGDGPAIAAFIAKWPSDTVLRPRDMARGPRCLRGVPTTNIIARMEPFVLGGWLNEGTDSRKRPLWHVRPGLLRHFEKEIHVYNDYVELVRSKFEIKADD